MIGVAIPFTEPIISTEARTGSSQVALATVSVYCCVEIDSRWATLKARLNSSSLLT